MRAGILGLFVAIPLVAAGAGPSDPHASDGVASSEGYCEFVRGVAKAESAILVAPALIGSVGAINSGTVTQGIPVGEPVLRITLGAEYDGVHLYQGMALRRKAEAECRRYLALSDLQALLRAGADLGSAAALRAREEVLAQAVPQAEAILAKVAEEVASGRSTIEELNAVRSRVDSLLSSLSETQVDILRVSRLPKTRGDSLPAILEAYREADDEVERISGSLRRAEAWGLTVRAGWDKIFTVEQKIPVFALLSVSFNLGSIWQGEGNRQAREGRSRWLGEDVMGADERISELVATLQAVRRDERFRHAQTLTLLADLDQQARAVEVMESSAIRRYRDYLWFERTNARATSAFLSSHLEALDAFLGPRE
ncbi:hypothetical protein [Vulgatibacter incomptus]|uniref:Heavy metal RND efflux outer membrane protein, CzcC family n=1 Tax=Vulgatibacter incomptus TaxID=1391653 RepID=A0A0K1P9G8_9BACT|nr:hypothetical protein [Vulgatibacter incomptus]AKU90183.1 hypothetical protein AKJ08_0570 [Vulgatibacter incomptus]